MPHPCKVLLVSTYELGHQPLGLASPAAWLRRDGFEVSFRDTAIHALRESDYRDVEIAAFHVPMHTATRLAISLLKRLRASGSTARVVFYGLYAPVNQDYLRALGVDAVIGGEYEAALLAYCRAVRDGKNGEMPPPISLERLDFLVPDRRGLPPLERYARLCVPGGEERITGYTEASRGCRHQCRHCPVVPVYGGKFRILPREIIMADIRQQVEAGARHITFGDPDFLNGPGHAIPLVETLHREFPALSYDVTIKVEHLLKHQRYLAVLKDSGCALITSAVESLDDRLLGIFNKNHSVADFHQAVDLCDAHQLPLNPTFVAFTPWTTLEGYRDLLKNLAELNLIDSISPVQLAIRLLIPEGSHLLRLPETQAVIGPFEPELLGYPWRHPDLRMDQLCQNLMGIIPPASEAGKSRRDIFEAVWEKTNQVSGEERPLPKPRRGPSRTEVPYLNEPWYC